MKKAGIIFLIFSIILFSSSFVNSDIISIDSGGNDEMVMNPSNYINGFFTCVPKTCAEYGYKCDYWDDDCGMQIYCGTCDSGYRCDAGRCLAVSPAGGPGGGAGATPQGVELYIVPTELNPRLEINTNKRETITVKNIGSGTGVLSVYQTGLDGKIIIEPSSITVPAGETREINVTFVAPETPGIYTGKIFIGGEQVLVSMDVKTQLLLFDSNIIVLNNNYKVGKGENLRTKVTLIPLGDKERMDVTLNYVIKDYEGKVYLTQSETVLVENQIDFKKSFDIGALPIGKYIVGLELVYPGGVAPSSAHFEIVTATSGQAIWKFILVVLVMITMILILIILVVVKRRREEDNSV